MLLAGIQEGIVIIVFRLTMKYTPNRESTPAEWDLGSPQWNEEELRGKVFHTTHVSPEGAKLLFY
ncbi:hypothetical protein K8I28_12680 [bacterium]|nr:hypothetical protein [bacterium]